MFGLKPAQIDEGGKILQQLARDWRELVAGSEGFLTDEKRRSLFRHNVVWGEMVWTGLRPLGCGMVTDTDTMLCCAV